MISNSLQVMQNGALYLGAGNVLKLVTVGAELPFSKKIFQEIPRFPKAIQKYQQLSSKSMRIILMPISEFFLKFQEKILPFSGDPSSRDYLDDSNFPILKARIRIAEFFDFCVRAPVLEEVFLRGIAQTVLLKWIPEFFFHHNLY